VNYFYIAYGVGIYSTSKIDGLERATPQATPFTLEYETGHEPEWVRSTKCLPTRILMRRSEDQMAEPTFILSEYGNGAGYELAYSDGARFVVDETAERMWGTLQPPLSREDLAVYFLGPVMGFVLRRRHVTCLHASAVEINERAVLFSGHPGYGKSTTAAALALRGVPVLCEDVVPLRLTEGHCWAIPGYPRVCLWPEAVAKLLGDSQSLPRLTPTWEKCYLPLDGVRAKFVSQKQPVGLIYLFGQRSSEANAPRIEELRPREALLELVQNTYMNWLLDRRQRAEEFDELCRLVQQVPVRRVVAHSDGEKLGALCDCIFQDSEKVLKHG
jgi:hypothetical protein